MQAIDDRDWQLYSSCLTDDIVDHAVDRAEGRAAVMEMVRRVIGTLARASTVDISRSKDHRQARARPLRDRAMHLFHVEAASGRLRRPVRGTRCNCHVETSGGSRARS